MMAFHLPNNTPRSVKSHNYTIKMIQRIDNSLFSQDGIARKLVLKTYFGRNAQTYYDNEVRAFTQIGRLSRTIDSSMINFYGGFKHDGRFNILLEFADKGTLEEYFSTNPPKSGTDIIKFWEHILQVTEALVDIHGNSEGTNMTQPLKGYVCALL
jgi:serine/threonine protein kinase